jgi:hypothetical protein
MNYVCTFIDNKGIDNIIKVWLPTLKKNFSGIPVVITFGVKEEYIEILKKMDVLIIEEDKLKTGRDKITRLRLKAQEKFIDTLKDTDKIMLIDGIDVVFQSEINSFFDSIKHDKIVYSEVDELMNYQTWYAFGRVFNRHLKEVKEIRDEIRIHKIKSIGMLAGTKEAFKMYFNYHNEAVNYFKPPEFFGSNQLILTYLVFKYPKDFIITDIHNHRPIADNTVIEDKVFKIKQTIPIIHFSRREMKRVYEKIYLKNEGKKLSEKIMGFLFNQNSEEIKEITTESLEQPKTESEIKEEKTKDIITEKVETLQNNKIDTETKKLNFLKDLIDKGIEVCLLEETCYEMIINNRLPDKLCIGIRPMVNNLSNDNITIKRIPKRVKTHRFKEVPLKVPIPVVSYLINLYGKKAKDALREVGYNA